MNELTKQQDPQAWRGITWEIIEAFKSMAVTARLCNWKYQRKITPRLRIKSSSVLAYL